MTDCGIVYITTASVDEAEKIADTLIEKRLAACVQIISEIDSFFWWEGRRSREREVFLMSKTRTELFSDIVDEVKAIHSYQVPEIIMIPILDSSHDYLKWIHRETKPPRTENA